MTATPWYVKAPAGAPDKYRVNSPTRFAWERCPDWVWRTAKMRNNIYVKLHDGMIYRERMADGSPVLYCEIKAGFHFAVSVAPNFPTAIPAACVHDWIYAHADEIAAAWCCSVWRVLRLADHWFLALMRYTRFGFRRTYFLAVRAAGYPFNRIGRFLSKKSTH